MLDLSQFKEWQEQEKDKASIRAYCIKDGMKDTPSLLDECRRLQENNRELMEFIGCLRGYISDAFAANAAQYNPGVHLPPGSDFYINQMKKLDALIAKNGGNNEQTK